MSGVLALESQRASASAPAVRASYMKNLLSTLGKRGHLEAIEMRDAALVREVEAASRLAWLPVALNVRVVEATVSSFGEQRGLEVLADCVYDQFESPLWKNFIGGAIRLLGTEPGSLGRWIPHALQLIFRDCGSWSATRTGERELSVEMREIPEELASHRLWVRSLGIGMRPLFPLCGTEGTSDLDRLDASQRRATYRLEWRAPA